MTCEEARRALSAGEPDAVAGHLAGCRSCRRWRETLEEVQAVLPAAVPAAPPGLATRILATLPAPGTAGQAPAAGTVAGAPRGGARRDPVGQPPAAGGTAGGRSPGGAGWWSRRAVATLAAAAATVAALGLAVLAGAGRDGSDRAPARVLAAAAETVVGREAVPVRFEVEGSLRARFPVPGAGHRRPAVPPDAGVERLREELERLREELHRRDLTEGLATPEAFGEVPGPGAAEALRGRLRRLERELDRAAGEQQAAVARLEEELARLSEEMAGFTGPLGRVQVTFEGGGAADGRGRSRAAVRYRIEAPVEEAGRLEIVTTAEATFVRSDQTGGWVRLEGPYEGFRFGDLTSPPGLHRVLARLREVDGPVEHLGERTLDGVRVRGFRLAREGGTVEAWVGVEDDRLYELREVRRAEGPRGLRAEARTAFRFHDYGAAVTIAEPTSWVPLEEVPPADRPPFAVSARIDLGGTRGDTQGP